MSARSSARAVLGVCLALPLSAQESVKPYFMVIVDNSGSMSASTGGATNSCGQAQTRMSDAKCVLQQILDGYGDVVFGLERYMVDCTGSCAPGCATDCGCSCSSLSCNSCNDNGGGCPAAGASADQGQVLVEIREDNQYDIREWVDFSCGACSTAGPDPELSAETWTPIAGSLRAARRYYEGADPTFPGSPIQADAYSDCRPYRVILLTDGEETCASDSETIAAATELRSTVVGAAAHDILTYVVGFGITPGDADIEDIAVAGGTDAPGPNRVYYATDETSLSLAFAQIIQDAILIEVCDNADNDCDGQTDEGFVKYCDLPGGVPTTTLCDDPGDPCDGVDDNCAAGTDDEPRNACGACGPNPRRPATGPTTTATASSTSRPPTAPAACPRRRSATTWTTIATDPPTRGSPAAAARTPERARPARRAAPRGPGARAAASVRAPRPATERTMTAMA